LFQEVAVLKNAVVTEADTVMVTVIVVVMDAVAMVVTVTVTVTDAVAMVVTVIAIVMVAVMVTVVVEVKVKVALDLLQMDAAKENIIAVHKLNKKRECPLLAFSFFISKIVHTT
jgi:hypothetical protein